jgi:hypothetical protein|uniref:Potassium/proton antiporter CemA n=1 Tax=Tetraselmis sp. CCMP 881 TaxID=1812852 RepID=A0A142BXZ2_9CHLO|nr:chloroplast enveloppe membrane protein [Tetraselmis sp. CCMP 881]
MKKDSTSGQASTVEKMGLIPRSIIRTFDRFRRQLWPGIENLVIQEFRISRYQLLVSLKALCLLILFPIFFNYATKEFIFHPAIEYFWNTKQTNIFLNVSQEKKALHQLENYEEKLYFESLVLPPLIDNNLDEDLTRDSVILNRETDKLTRPFLKEKLQEKYFELASEYNSESIEALANLATDISTAISFWFLAIAMKPQLIILKSFLTEFLYSFGDTTKSFLLLFITDLFVGFHSPHGWEVFLESVMDRFGIAENEDFIFLFVATVPVLLDTLIKYWIFRYLNKVSPSTVATYHSLIE